MCSTVLGSYAHFMWEAGEDEDEDEDENPNGGGTSEISSAGSLVPAF